MHDARQEGGAQRISEDRETLEYASGVRRPQPRGFFARFDKKWALRRTPGLKYFYQLTIGGVESSLERCCWEGMEHTTNLCKM